MQLCIEGIRHKLSLIPLPVVCNGCHFISLCTASCQSGASRCSSGQCIRLSGLCDGTPDCSDGSDENGCGMHRLYCGLGNLIGSMQ